MPIRFVAEGGDKMLSVNAYGSCGVIYGQKIKKVIITVVKNATVNTITFEENVAALKRDIKFSPVRFTLIFFT